jgi:ABC-type transporter Mla subunit MlaD
MSQPRDRDRLYKRSVGVLVIFSVLAVLVMLRLYQQTAGPFHATLTLRATLPRADGVAVDTPVTLAGLKVGRVSGIGLTDDNRVRLDLVIEARVSERIRQNSRAVLMRPLIGAAFVDIEAGSGNSPVLADGAEITAVRAPDLNDLATTLPQRLVAVDAILDNAQALTADLRRTTRELTAKNGPIDRSVARVEQLTVNAAEAAARLNRTLDEVRRVVAETGTAIDSANLALADARGLIGELRPLGPRSVEIASSIERSLANVEAVSAELRALGPQLAPTVAAGQVALEEADDVLRAARNSFLLRGNLPPPAAAPGAPVPRP